MTERPNGRTDPPTDWRPRRFRRTLGELRSRPKLFVPFLITAFVGTTLGWLHRRDPLVTLSRRTLADGTVQLEYIGYPAGARGTTLSVEALFGLRASFLAWGVSTYTLVLAVHAIAGAVVIARVLGVEPNWRTVGSLLLYIATIDLVHQAARTVDGLQYMPPALGLPVLAGWLFVLVRLFAVPGLIVAGRPVIDAVLRSWRLTEGHGWRLLGGILALGLGNAVLAVVPVVGPALGTALVGTIHAAYVGVFVKQVY